MPLATQSAKFSDRGPTTSATAPKSSSVEAVDNPWTDDGQKASDCGILRSDVNLGSPMTMRPLEALEVKLTPQSWKTVVALCRRDGNIKASLLASFEESGSSAMAMRVSPLSSVVDDATLGYGDTILMA
jgi:hypothetical protein